MGFELGYALHRRWGLSPAEIDLFEQHLRAWRARITGYDWFVPRDEAAASGPFIAWGTAHVTDEAAPLVEAALADIGQRIKEAHLVFDRLPSAQLQGLPIGSDAWVSVAGVRRMLDGRPTPDPTGDRRKRPTTRGANRLVNADRPTLINVVLAPQGRVSDLERTHAVEQLAEDPDPSAAAALVQRARQDNTERKWTAVLLRGLASTTGRCSWATPLLAMDRGWRGAAELVVASVDEDAVPYLERLPIGRVWSAMALLALYMLPGDEARAAKDRLLERVVDPVPAARLLVVDTIATAHRLRGAEQYDALLRIRAAVKAYGSAGGDAQGWLAHQREAGARALSILDGELVAPETISLGLAALAEYAVTGRDAVRLPDALRLELWKLEADWLARHGYTTA